MVARGLCGGKLKPPSKMLYTLNFLVKVASPLPALEGFQTRALYIWLAGPKVLPSVRTDHRNAEPPEAFEASADHRNAAVSEWLPDARTRMDVLQSNAAAYHKRLGVSPRPRSSLA